MDKAMQAMSEHLGEDPYLKCVLGDDGLWSVYNYRTEELIDADIRASSRDNTVGTLCAGYTVIKLTISRPDLDGITSPVMYVWAIESE